jgi:hypothetical protein
LAGIGLRWLDQSRCGAGHERGAAERWLQFALAALHCGEVEELKATVSEAREVLRRYNTVGTQRQNLLRRFALTLIECAELLPALASSASDKSGITPAEEMAIRKAHDLIEEMNR